MHKILAVTKALADASRARVLMALGQGPLCVCQVIQLMELAPSTVSKHLTVLQQAGLLESTKEGRWIYYRLPGKAAPPHVRQAIAWLASNLEQDPVISADRRRLKGILKMPLSNLCCHYKKNNGGR